MFKKLSKYSYLVAFTLMVNSSFVLSEDFNPKNFSQIEVELKNFNKAISCKNIAQTTYYNCKTPAGDNLFIRYKNGFHAMLFDKTNSPKPIELQKIVAQNKSLYQAPVFPDLSAILGKKDDVKKEETPPKNLEDDYLQKVAQVEDFFPASEIAKLPEDFKKILTNIIKEKDSFRNKYKSALNGVNFEVSLIDGQKLSCQRLTTQPNANDSLCGYFDCGKNHQGDNQILIYDTLEDPGFIPTLQTFSNESLKKSQDVLELRSPIVSNPLVNTKKMLQNENDSSYKDREEAQKVLSPELMHQTSNLAFLKDDFYRDFDSHTDKTCKSSPLINNYKKQKENLLKKISEMQVYEFIEILEDDELISNYLSFSAASKNGCYHDGRFFNADAAKSLPLLSKNFAADQTPLQTITMRKAQELFKKARAMKDIAWKYKADGCYARAHLMARRFEKEGIRVDKAWLKGDLYVAESNTEWNYHVAPLVYVKNQDGSISKMIIDPSIFDKPVTLEEWDNKITKRTVKGSVRTVFPFPQNAALVERAALAISTSNPYMPGDSLSMTEEKKMELAKETMIDYLEVSKDD